MGSTTPSTWGRGEGGSSNLAVLLCLALSTWVQASPTVVIDSSEPSTGLSRGLGVGLVVVRAVVVREEVVVVVGGLWEASRLAREGAVSLSAGRAAGAAVSPSVVETVLKEEVLDVASVEEVVEEVMEVLEVLEVLEVRVRSVLGSRARAAAARGVLVSRSEEREVERVLRVGGTWYSEVAAWLVAAAAAAASRRARNSARRAALRRRSEGARRRAASPPPGAPGGWWGCWG